MIRPLTIAISTCLGPLAGSAPPALRDLVEPRAGQLCVYEGKTSVEQKTGARPLGAMENRASLGCYVAPGGKPDELRVLVTRTLAPSSSGVALPPFSDAAIFHLEPSLELVPAAPPGSDPRLRVLESQLPVDVLPSFELPAGDEAAREETVRIPGAATAKLPVVVKVSRSGDRVTLARTLAAGKTGATELDGQAATVTAWSERFLCDASRKVVLEVRREVKILGLRGGEPTELRHQLELTAKEVRSLAAEEAAAMGHIEKELDGTLADLAAKKPAREIYARIVALETRPAAKLLPGLEDALLARLAHHRQEEDRTRRRAAAAGALDKEASDFTLEDLGGNKVNLREAVRGKVALLCFWYTTCPPCRKEAPYLTRLVEKYGEKGFTVIAVNARDESREAVKAFVDAQGLKHQVLLMGQAVAQQYRVLGYPTAFWIDHQGRVVDRVTGFRDESYPEMEARVETLLLAAQAKQAVQGQGK